MLIKNVKKQNVFDDHCFCPYPFVPDEFLISFFLCARLLHDHHHSYYALVIMIIKKNISELSLLFLAKVWLLLQQQSNNKNNIIIDNKNKLVNIFSFLYSSVTICYICMGSLSYTELYRQFNSTPLPKLFCGSYFLTQQLLQTQPTE